MNSRAVTFHRTLFLSDFHIGSKRFDADALLDFLRHNNCDTLYLVGDIIDGWKLQKRWYWTESVSAIFDELILKASNGTKIIYITGNHDEAVRFLPLYRRLRFSRRHGIQIKNKIIHETLSGRKFLVLHGDQFDRKLIGGPLSKLGDRLYDLFLDLTGGHRHVDIVIDGKTRPFSMAKFLGTQGQRALNLLNDFEAMVVKTAREEKTDGLICGHTHIPVLKSLRGVLYGNCGSWVRGGHTALAEDCEGRLVLIDWSHYQKTEQPCLFRMEKSVLLYPDAGRFRPSTERLIHSIRRTFVPPQTCKQQGLINDIRREAVRLGRLVLAHQIRLQANESDQGMRDQICWNPL